MKRIKDYIILYESILKKEKIKDYIFDLGELSKKREDMVKKMIKKECEEIIEFLSKNNAYIYLTEKKFIMEYINSIYFYMSFFHKKMGMGFI